MPLFFSFSFIRDFYLWLPEENQFEDSTHCSETLPLCKNSAAQRPENRLVADKDHGSGFVRSDAARVFWVAMYYCRYTLLRISACRQIH